MKDNELVALVDQELSSSLGNDSDLLSDQRSKAMEYYLGEPYGNEQPDRANIVTREVLDTIEWIKPELMKLFASGTETVRFEPQTMDDVEGAQQATDYINYLFHRKNGGFKVLYQWITDGLLQKNGIVKCYFDNSVKRRRESYKDLTPLEAQALVMEPGVEPIEIQEGETVSLDIIREGGDEGLKVINIPPEEFRISRKAVDIETSPFCAHVTRMTISDLNAMGYDTDEIGSDDTGVLFDAEEQSRHKHDDTGREVLDTTSSDPSMREVWVSESYVRCDFDDDGVAELRKVVKAGGTVLENEEVDCMPFAGWTPIIISHKFHGLSVADLVMDLQRLQSQLFRNMLDNQYLTNNGRYEAVENMVNMDDLTTSRPHGVVRVKMSGAVRRLDTPQLGATAFQMLEYVDRLREKRTGVSERSQGLDPNQLSANTAATAVNQVMVAAQQRVELIARVFGETGLTDLFRLMYKTVIQNQKTRDIFRLRDQYVEVDPSDWDERKDTSVVVGLGNGSREQEMLQLNMIFNNQMALANNPQTSSIVMPQNVYHALEDQVKVFNKAASGRYFTDPNSDQAKAAQMEQAQQAQQAQQMQNRFAEMSARLEQMDLQIKAQRANNDNANKQRDLDIKQQKQDLDVREHTDDVTLRTAELQAEVSLEADQKRGVDIG